MSLVTTKYFLEIRDLKMTIVKFKTDSGFVLSFKVKSIREYPIDFSRNTQASLLGVKHKFKSNKSIWYFVINNIIKINNKKFIFKTKLLDMHYSSLFAGLMNDVNFFGGQEAMNLLKDIEIWKVRSTR